MICLNKHIFKNNLVNNLFVSTQETETGKPIQKPIMDCLCCLNKILLPATFDFKFNFDIKPATNL
jgi:hypothetical protein